VQGEGCLCVPVRVCVCVAIDVVSVTSFNEWMEGTQVLACARVCECVFFRVCVGGACGLLHFAGRVPVHGLRGRGRGDVLSGSHAPLGGRVPKTQILVTAKCECVECTYVRVFLHM